MKPLTPLKSYSIYSGVQDALVQWWYGHNAVAFFLTTPILGIMYYFLPKAAERPVYSYRLSVVHFWALVFIYIWAGPHHLLYTALPEWSCRGNASTGVELYRQVELADGLRLKPELCPKRPGGPQVQAAAPSRRQLLGPSTNSRHPAPAPEPSLSGLEAARVCIL